VTPPRPAWERVQVAALPPLLGVLRRMPGGPARGALILVGIVQAFLDGACWGRARAWAAVHASGPGDRRRLLARLLANRGRFLATALGIGTPDPESFRRHLVFEGRDRLDALARTGGIMLLGFHLGPGGTAAKLGLAGYPVTTAGAGLRFRVPAPSYAWVGGARSPSIVWGDAPSRAAGLHRLSELLQQGGIVSLTADSREDGRPAFEVPLPGRTLRVRAGWFVLRRLTGAPTLPVLTSEIGRRSVVTIHPPLPDPDPDLERDRAACREALAPILREYVRRFPEQCLSLALWPDEAARP